MNCDTRYYCTTPRRVCQPNNRESNRASAHWLIWSRLYLVGNILKQKFLDFTALSFNSFALDQLRCLASQKIWWPIPLSESPIPLSESPIPLSEVRSCRVKANKGNRRHSGRLYCTLRYLTQSQLRQGPSSVWGEEKGKRQTGFSEQLSSHNAKLTWQQHPTYLQQKPTSRIICYAYTAMGWGAIKLFWFLLLDSEITSR